MDRIQLEPHKKAPSRVARSDQGVKGRIAQGLLNNAGIITGTMIMFAVVAIVTTDVRMLSPEEVTSLGLGFFLLLFCSYSMHVSCADSGMRAGLRHEAYTEAVEDYDTLKDELSEQSCENLLYLFCKEYIETELKNARMAVILDVGLSYEIYHEKYLGKGEDEIEKDKELTGPQKKAVCKANKIKPIKLTPDMITKRGRGDWRRAPLGIRPITKKRVHFVWKFVKTLVIAFTMCLIAFDFVSEPSWKMFVTCFVKLLTVGLNGFDGYRFGYENIVTDTVNYMNDQMDLMKQALNFAKARTEAQADGRKAESA